MRSIKRRAIMRRRLALRMRSRCSVSSSQTEREKEGQMIKQLRNKFHRYLKDLQKSGKRIGLSELYSYLIHLTRALHEELRWAELDQKNFDRFKAGAKYRESVLEHTGIHVPILGIEMLAIELMENPGISLNVWLHQVAFTVHDLCEALTGDESFMLKVIEDDDNEREAFELIISVLDKRAHPLLTEAFELALEANPVKKKKKPLCEISLNGRFFYAV